MNPRIIKAHSIGYKEKLIKIDFILWLMGKYSLEAQTVALAHFGAGLAGKESQAEYLESPYMQKNEKAQLSYDLLSEEEKQREVDKFFAQESARRANWKRTHKK